MLLLLICCQEGISSPSMSAQILDFCDEGDLFPETSCGGGGGGSGGADICCYDDDTFPSDLDASALSTLLDSELQSDPEADAVLAANYPSSQLPPPPAAAFPVPGYLSNPQDPLDQVGFPDMAAIDGFSSFLSEPLDVPLSASPRPAPLQPPPSLPHVFDDECISTLSSYMGLEPSPSSTSCSFMDPTQLGGPFYPGAFGVSALEEGLGFFPGAMAAGPETGIHPPEVMVEYRGDNSGRGGGGGVGIYGLDNTAHQRIYGGPCELQALGDHQQLVNGCGSPTAPLASDVPPLEDSTFKVGRLSVEERKERIHRYMKKRNERNFSKKIKVGVKEEEDIIHSSDIYAHLSSMSSFKCNYSALESWL
ncbi:hypothetical protein Taro_028284 [Colocasia esculenta]|uniref:Uncharacterized protein n=1 Tax=Colocasia esculenta TaxID=4460 RepID=A0A843VMP7_COLES|nr:hypothetical protein [Colocasia esculenta]